MQVSALIRPAAVGASAVAIGLYAEWAYSRTGAGFVELARDAVVGWTFAGAGLVARRRRPGSRTGLLMIIEGLTWFVGNLQGTALPALVGAGAWLEGLNDAVLAHLVLSFPSGRLETRPARLAVAATYALVVGGGLLWAMAFDPRVDGWATYLSCPGCGPNALLVDPDPHLFATVDLIYQGLGAALGAACAALVASRWIAADSRTRRILLPTWTLVVVGVVFGTWALLTTLDPEMSGGPGQPVLWAADLSQLAVPVALLWGLVRMGRRQRPDARDRGLEPGRRARVPDTPSQR